MTDTDAAVSPLDTAIERLKSTSTALSLDRTVTETAIRIYTTVFEDELYHGRKRQDTLSGVLFIACRECDAAVTPESISNVLGVSQESVLSTARYLVRELDIVSSRPIQWSVYVDYACSELDVSREFIQTAYDIAEQSVAKNIHSGRSPRSFAAGAVYAAGQISDTRTRYTQDQISGILNVSTTAIRDTYHAQLDSYTNND